LGGRGHFNCTTIPRETSRQADTQTDRQTNRQTNTQSDTKAWQTGRQRDEANKRVQTDLLERAALVAI